jgi:hypothetical protein
MLLKCKRAGEREERYMLNCPSANEMKCSRSIRTLARSKLQIKSYVLFLTPTYVLLWVWWPISHRNNAYLFGRK